MLQTSTFFPQDQVKMWTLLFSLACAGAMGDLEETERAILDAGGQMSRKESEEYADPSIGIERLRAGLTGRRVA